MSPGTLALTATPRGSLQGFRKAVPYSLGDQLWASLVLGVYPAGSGSQEPAGWGSVPGRQREAQSSPAWTQLTEAGVGSAAQAPAASVRRRRKQRISKTKSRWSVKDPRTPSPQPCPAPLHPPCCRGTLSSASKTRQLGQAEGRPTAQPSSQADPPHPGSLLSCRPLPLLGVPWATCGGRGGQSDTPAPSPKACCVQAECARACTHPAQTPCSCKELKGFWAVCYC